MTDQKTPTADGMLGMLDMLTVAAIRGADFDAAYRRAAHAFHVVEPPTIHHVGPPTINLPDVRVGQTHRVVWENARVCDVHDDGNGAVTIEYNDGSLAALFGHPGGNPEPSLYLIADVEPEPVDDDVIAIATIANAEALDRIAAALERIADTLDTRQTLDMLGDT